MAGVNDYKGLMDFFRNTEERLPIGYYLAAIVIIVMLGLYGLMMITGLTADALFMTAITDGLNFIATLVFSCFSPQSP